MPDYRNAQQLPLPELEGTDRFTLRNKSEIRAQLITLSRQPDIITAYFNEGKRYFLTAVLGVIDERGLLVLDVGPDEAITKLAIASGRLVCSTRHNGIPIRFSCENLQSARFQALPAIAASLPESLYRMQRREYFRVTTPRINGPRCEIPDPLGGEPFLLTVTDICAGGQGLVDTSGRMVAEVMDRFEGCRILLPEHGEIRVNLMIRNCGTLTTASGELLARYGASFEGLSVSDNASLQRYIFQLQALQPR
ncbi:MAG: flagellar brake protein [Gammaproteobacteria bacterium]|nr:flagellar brake protein [Gammaproteobacteria bacterium]